MAKHINIKKIIKENRRIKEKSFREEQKLIGLRRDAIRAPKYNILPPFSTERRIRAFAELEEKEACS